MVLKLGDAGYLVLLGVRLLFARTPATPMTEAVEEGGGILTVFHQGMLTNVLNPKVALFFLAFMPQFISADSANKPFAFLVLGLCFVATGTLWCLCLAWFASSFSERLRGNCGFGLVLNRAAGALFVLLGIRLATSH